MWSKYCLFWSLRVLNEIDRSDTEEEVEETNIVTLGPEKRNTQQELIDVDRSYFVNEEGAASVSEDNYKTCSGGNGRREREKVQIKKNRTNSNNGTSQMLFIRKIHHKWQRML